MQGSTLAPVIVAGPRISRCGIHAEAMEDGPGCVEGQVAVGGDSDDFEDELRSLGDDLVADLRRRRRSEELARWLSGLGFGIQKS